MYVCPTCNKEFETEDGVAKHYLKCWKQYNIIPPTKSAVHSEPIETREVSDDILDFFSSFEV